MSNIMGLFRNLYTRLGKNYFRRNFSDDVYALLILHNNKFSVSKNAPRCICITYNSATNCFCRSLLQNIHFRYYLQIHTIIRNSMRHFLGGIVW